MRAIGRSAPLRARQLRTAKTDRIEALSHRLRQRVVMIGSEKPHDTWVVHFQRGPDSLVVVVRFEEPSTRSLEDLRIVQMFVPSVLAVEDWKACRGADAVATAGRRRSRRLTAACGGCGSR